MATAVKGENDWQEVSALCPNPGDIIEFQRAPLGNQCGYYHVGIYIGDDTIAHKTNIDIGTAILKKSRLQDEAGKNRCRINNQTDLATELGLKVRPVKKILECVDATEGTIEPYDVMRFNCEEWATRMRYGRGWSSQADIATGKRGSFKKVLYLSNCAACLSSNNVCCDCLSSNSKSTSMSSFEKDDTHGDAPKEEITVADISALANAH